MRVAVKPLAGSGREDVVKITSSVLPVKHEFSQAVLEGKVDPIGVLTHGRESIPAIDVAKAKLEIAKEEEQNAINAANQYVVDNMGWLDMKDPSELQALNDAVSVAKANREKAEREFYLNPDSFEAKVGDFGKFGRAAATVISKPFLAADVAMQTAKDAASDQNKVDMTSLPMLKYGQMQEARASVTEDMSKAGAWLTNAGLSIADSAYSRLLGLGTPVGTGLVSGVSASADKMYDVAQSGEDADRALVRGLVSGGISGASEGMSVGNLAKLLKKDGAKTVLGTMAKQGGFEATEEGVDYVANYIADKAFQDPNAKFNWSELLSNMGMGGLSGAVFAGTGIAGSYVSADTNVPTSGAAQPSLAQQITTMQKQLADMQKQKQLDEFAAVYEKNVGPIESVTSLDEPVAVGYDKLNEGLGRQLPEGEKAKPGSIKLVVRDSKFEDFDGNVDWETWAPNGGRVPGTVQEGQILKGGTIIDRYGDPYGRYASPVGVPYEQRALPYVEDANTYHRYEVIKPIDHVTISQVAPAFEQPGGGIQYELPLKINHLIKEGYLREVTK